MTQPALPAATGVASAPSLPTPTPVSSSSLDPLETTGDSLPWQTRSQLAVHARDHDARTRIYSALTRSADSRLTRRADRLAACCAHPLLCLRQDGRPFVSMQACRDRLCPHCQRVRGRTCATAIACELHRFNAPRFITLTLAHRDASLREELDRLALCFRRLRQRPEWRRHIIAGVYAIEVTHEAAADRWHVHLHIIADGQFWDQRSLSKTWHAVTGDSPIVDIRTVPDRRQIANYVARYVAKPAQLDEWPAERICEFALAMHGRRLLHTFGAAHGRQLLEEEPEPTPAASEPLVSLTALIRFSDRGDARAQTVRAMLRRLGPRESAAAALPPIPQGDPRPPLTDDEITTLVGLARAIAADVAAERFERRARHAPRPKPATPPPDKQPTLIDIRPESPHGRML